MTEKRVKPPTEIISIWAVAAVLTLDQPDSFEIVPLLSKILLLALTVSMVRQTWFYLRSKVRNR